MKFFLTAIAALLLTNVASPQDLLEEVVVTAGFRDQTLMQSAGSVTVLDAELIRHRAAEHLESVLNLSPNVGYSSGASRARFVQVRGVGDLEQFVDPKHFPSVGISVDGINLGGSANAAMLFDTEQVEVLRGPQGTRFGTSALAGLVNVTSRQPTQEFEGYVSLGVADYGTQTFGAALSGPLGDTVSARVAVQQHTSDGYIRNEFLGRDDTNGYDETSVRASLSFDPSDRAAYSVTAFEFDGDNGYDAFSLDNRRSTLTDQPGHDRQATTAVAARGEWAVGAASRVEAMATRLDSDLEYGFDEDWTFVGICDGALCDPVLDFFSNTDNYFRDRSESTIDVRWLTDASNTDGMARQYVFGFFEQQRDEDLRRQYYGDFLSQYATERRAVYGQVQADLSSRLKLTAGFRYEQFEDSYSDSFAFASLSDDTLHNGELSLSYQASPSTLLYATLTRGNKAGGVNTEASANLPFMQPQFQAFVEPRLRIGTEALLNREVGVKGEYLNHRLRLQAALFHMDRDQAQLESWFWDDLNFLWIGFLNNVDGSNWGAEAEFSFVVNQRWELAAALSRLETEVDAITSFDLDAGVFVQRRDIDQAKSPSWQYNFSATWSPADRWTARFEIEGRDGSHFGYYHDKKLDGYSLLNTSLRYDFGAAELTLWARNVTDQAVDVHALYFGNDPRKGWVNETYYQLGEPRLVGVSVQHSF